MSTSFFDAIFQRFGVPSLMAWNADQSQYVMYRDSRCTDVPLRAIIQDRQSIEREFADGTRVKLDTCTVIVSTDPESGYGAVGPQLNSVWSFDGHEWVIDLEGDTQGIEAVTGNLARVRLRKVATIARGYPELTRRT